MQEDLPCNSDVMAPMHGNRNEAHSLAHLLVESMSVNPLISTNTVSLKEITNPQTYSNLRAKEG